MCASGVALGPEKKKFFFLNLPPPMAIRCIIRTVGEIWIRSIENYNNIHQGEPCKLSIAVWLWKRMTLICRKDTEVFKEKRETSYQQYIIKYQLENVIEKNIPLTAATNSKISMNKCICVIKMSQ